MWCTHCYRAFWWETAELVKAKPPPPSRHTMTTRGGGRKPEPPPAPYYMTGECELNRMAREAREAAARDAGEGSAAVAAAA